MMKSLLHTLAISACLTGCSGGYFSNYETVYRIETNNGERYYSDSKPSLNSNGEYQIEDLDGNEYQLKKDAIYKIEKYRHKK